MCTASTTPIEENSKKKIFEEGHQRRDINTTQKNKPNIALGRQQQAIIYPYMGLPCGLCPGGESLVFQRRVFNTGCYIPTSQCLYRTLQWYYRIALIFRVSKFSRITALKEFVEKIWRIRVAHVCYSTVAKILVK